MPLTDAAIRAAKPSSRPVKYSDGGGLHLLVTPTGSRLWRMQYRYCGKQKTLAFGSYPLLSLAEARVRRDEAKRQLADGFDPSDKVRLAKIAKLVASSNTFDLLADEYLGKLVREAKADRTVEKARWLLEFARPLMGQRPVSEIGAIEVLAVLRKLEGRGRLESARRLRSTISRVFRYAIATARAEDDPTIALRGALATPIVKPRAAITDGKAFGSLLRAIDGFDGQPTTRAALKLMAHLFPRPGELRVAEWSEFDFEKAVWTIPPEHAKMRRPHRTPLSCQAIEILKGLQAITGSGKLVLPSVRTLLRPMSENTLNAALRRLGYSQDEATAHGFRATASTLLHESNLWNADAIERQLAHVEGNDIRRAYARGEHWEERTKMMSWWSNYLDTLRTIGQIVAFPLKRG